MKKTVLLAIAAFSITSCCKEGTNGDATVVVYAKHHNNIIINHVGYPDTVYVKFNAKDLPGTKPSDYDTYFVGNSQEREDHIHCGNLKCGDYFLYVAGYDSSINSRVTGGLHLKIKHKQRKEEMSVDIAVTE